MTNTSGNILQRLQYLPFGQDLIDQRAQGYDGASYTFSGKQKDMATGYSYFGARYYDASISICLSVTCWQKGQPSITPYHFVSNNPINRIDPDGRRDIQVHSYNDRAKSGYALLIVTDNDGFEVYRTVVKTIGTGGRVRNVKNSDTSQGKNKISGYRKTVDGTGYNQVSFGPNDILALDYQGGEGGKRNGMHVHGGRQEGKYKGRKNLASTHGCIRINDDDIQKMKEITTELEKNDPTEKKGNLILMDDLKTPIVYDANRNTAGTHQFPVVVPAPAVTPTFVLPMPPLIVPIDNTYVAPPLTPVDLTKKN